MLQNWKESITKKQFLFEELVKRDFKQKYKRTVLGMGWSILSPLLTLLVMKVVFTQFFGRTMDHYTTYLFAGNLMFNFFRESTNGGMNALMANRHIFTKINMPKYIFLLTKNVSAIINFGITLLVFFLFAAIDGVAFSWRFVTILYPVLCLMVFNIGVGLILSALFVFFRDISYLYDVFTMLLMYLSAIFYTVESYSPAIQNLFLLNPVYCAIQYVRTVVLRGTIPGLGLHVLLLSYAALAMLFGGLMYKKKNHQFLYYV
ncbi:MAG: ABC transporter permease [Clostridia bacterium]|nr:ABC transporter permease [Clostridia bacterium]